ncbi:MAG: RIP metalloprotease RseP [Chitinispirillaceae bacterium]|nr:RIP metalloprotease RseP [Chitinispirillaceae bacterium]
MTVVLSVILGIFILGIMVVIHELGHFIAAKAFRFKVLAFSIGFGKALLKKTIGETEYRLSAIPFGGYVKMAGENPEEDREGAPDEFQMKPKHQRAIVAVAGPLANFVSAIFMLWIMYMYGVNHPTFYGRSIIGYVADSSAAKSAGLAAGDSIVSVNGKAIGSWDDLEELFLTGSKTYVLSIVRDGKRVTRTMEREPDKGDLYSRPPYGLFAPLPAVIGGVRDTMPAAAAGLKAGDTVTAINGVSVISWFQLTDLIQKGSHEKPLLFSVKRPEGHAEINVTPAYDASEKRKIVGIEVARSAYRIVRYSPARAFHLCLDKSWEYTTLIFKVLQKLISREVSTRELAGPVGIIPASGIVALQGLSPILNFMALISINLAVLNLFPLIITDGGVLLFLLLEAVRRKPLSIKTQIAITRFAIAFFIVFFLYVSLNDINRMPELFRMFGR